MGKKLKRCGRTLARVGRRLVQCCPNQGEPTDPGTPIDACCPMPAGPGIRSWSSAYDRTRVTFPIPFRAVGLPDFPDVCAGANVATLTAGPGTFRRDFTEDFWHSGNFFYPSEVEVRSFFYETTTLSTPGFTRPNFSVTQPNEIPMSIQRRYQRRTAVRNRADLGSEDPPIDQTDSYFDSMRLEVPFSTGGVRTHRNIVQGAFVDGRGPFQLDYNVGFVGGNVNRYLDGLRPDLGDGQRDSVATSVTAPDPNFSEYDTTEAETLSRTFFVSATQWSYAVVHEKVFDTVNVRAAQLPDLRRYRRVERLTVSIGGTIQWAQPCFTGAIPAGGVESIIRRIRGR